MTALLLAQGLTKRFDGVIALDDVTVSLGVGEILGLFGPNGAGKTTLFNAITGMVKADAGHVVFDGRRLDGMAAHRIPRVGVMRTFQTVRLIRQASLIENLLLFERPHPGENLLSLVCSPAACRHAEQGARDRAMAVLKRLYLEGLAYDKAEALSYGQQKLLSIGCCLMANARVLLLDEPVAGIAPEMVERVLSLIRDVASEGRSAIVIEHNIDALATTSHRLVFMDSGKVVCEGTPEQVLAQYTVLDAYLR